MKLRIFAVMALLFVLVACQNAEENSMDNNMDEGNVEPTRYDNNSNLGQEMVDKNNSMQRDADQNQNTKYDVSEEAAEKISNQVEGIEDAYVLTTDNNAYVGAHLNQDNNNENNGQSEQAGDNVSDETKQQIADIVRSVDNSIENVYVTTNPDFMDLTDRYINDLDEGRPIEGFFDQFGNMIERIFPNNR
ncbi:YhcN/YlaJ family sporulation lipoprotein [Oceanobacillus kimchii]|uniref:YhcN/YlaJ family sporulation lipoprotein n=1 Tax=Oceanobacillus kimchii TaxID=746691 RepID=A0ABQ5TFB4_9BACI|nr:MULTISPECIES: YhcN/YlaJ family sporulation lipoprotein [Oceanobacillus]MCT1578615.1 YhcN/YlaJ family sporulation lipoprotein [Oceanobacillus kimchii]MCT2136336.1 YhcN/YlaJ family sporulation lipoprotein [Oceanobacillus kimchii]OEH54254.1 hypothetical protein AQ616_10865 [Oceanobacillus sp. E9]GLO65556.1 hypothetical protein MACH08_13400 [Oceanobacillus kimchii]